MAGELVVQRSRLAASPLGKALRYLGQKQLGLNPLGVPGPPGFNVGWRNLRGRASLPRAIKNYLDTYGGTDDSVIWVYACASLISTEVSGYPWDVLDPEDNVLQPNEVPQELADLLDRPNRLLTYRDWVTWTFLDLELGGNSYWLKDRTNAQGQPFELIRLRPEYMRRAVDKQGFPVGHVYELQGRQIPYKLSDVIWYRYPDPRDELYGIGTVEAIMRELGADLAAREHVVGFYSQGGRVSGVVTVEGGMNEQQFQRLQRQMEEDSMLAGSDFRLLLIEQGNDFKAITQAPGDTTVVPLQRMTKDRILAGFHVPEPLLGGVLENANYKIADSRYVFADRVRPKAMGFSERTTIDLVDLYEGRQFLLDVTVNEPPHERAERMNAARGSGLSLNQMLDGLGFPVIDNPEADEPLIDARLVPYSLALAGGTSRTGLTGVLAAGGVVPAETPAQVPPKPTEGGGNEPTGGGPGSADNEPQPQEAPPGSEPSQLYALKMRAPRPRTHQQRRVRRAKSRFDNMGDVWVPPHLVRRLALEEERKSLAAAVQRVQARLGKGDSNGDQPALPDAPQAHGYPLIGIPPLPEGYEELGEVILKRADATMAIRMLAQRHETLRNEFPQWHQGFVDFFMAQRGRVLQRLEGFQSSGRAVSAGRKKPKAKLTGEALWGDEEQQALLDAYLPMAARVGGDALTHVGELVGSSLRWDLAIPEVAAVQARIGAKVTRINDTTRQAIGDQVEVGLQRGYSVVQIANGVATENYPGIVGVFDQASRYRAEMIARSETAMVYNDTATAGYEEVGITQVEVIDGTGDEICADANGSVWSLEEAQAEPIGHPNCVRAFAPIIGNAGAAGLGVSLARGVVAASAGAPGGQAIFPSGGAEAYTEADLAHGDDPTGIEWYLEDADQGDDVPPA